METFDIDGDDQSLTIEQIEVKSLTLYIFDRMTDVDRLETQQEKDALSKYLESMTTLVGNLLKGDIVMVKPMKKMLLEKYPYLYPADYKAD